MKILSHRSDKSHSSWNRCSALCARIFLLGATGLGSSPHGLTNLNLLVQMVLFTAYLGSLVTILCTEEARESVAYQEGLGFLHTTFLLLF